MSNHEILGPALQKYYSALKSLYDFGQHGDFFDDVSNLDKFFSEFRNITFVVQKGVCTEENKKIYTQLRTQYLTGETSKWFIETRNKTTKERPFELTKELSLDLYLPFGVLSLTDSRLVVNFDDSFSNALEFIRTAFLEHFGFSVILFKGQDLAGFGVDLVLIFPVALPELHIVVGHMIPQLRLGPEVGDLVRGEAPVRQGDGLGLLSSQILAGGCGNRGLDRRLGLGRQFGLTRGGG